MQLKISNQLYVKVPLNVRAKQIISFPPLWMRIDAFTQKKKKKRRFFDRKNDMILENFFFLTNGFRKVKK